MSRKNIVTFLVLIAGCSPIATQNSLDNEIIEDVPAVDTSSLADELSNEENALATEEPQVSASSKGTSEVLLNGPKGGLSIVEELSLTQDKYLVKLNSSEPLLNVMKLSNPPRLVVDVVGSKNAASQEVKTSEASNVSIIRLGSHSDKLRIVLDLKTDEALNSQSVQSAGNDVLITIPVSNKAKAQRLALLSSNAGARAQLSPSADSQEQGLAADKGLDSQAIVEETGSLENNRKSLSDLASLEDVDFTKTNASSGEVTLKLSTPVAFELSQTAQSEYVLTLPRVKPVEAVLAPMISTKGKEGIRTVRVVEEEDKTLVRFFVDPGITLSAIPRDEKILIKPATSLAGKDSSSRAQLGEPGAAPKVDDKSAQANPTGLRSNDGSKIYTGRLISLDLQDTDIDNALRIIAEVSNLNIIASDDVAGKVTLRFD